MIKLDRINAIASKQGGLIRRQQLKSLGVSKGQIAFALESGALLSEARAVYRLAGVAYSADLELWRAVLWGGPGTFVSHVTAGWVWKLDGVGRRRPEVIDVSVVGTRSLRPPKEVRLHRSRSLKLGKHTTIEKGIPVTSLERTLVDLSSVLSSLDLDKAVDSACRRFPKIKETTCALLATLSARGRPGYFTLKKLVDDPASLGPTGSGLEVEVREAIEKAGIRMPMPQLQICDADGDQIGVFDFAWPESMVVLLCHSRQWHSTWNQHEKDHDQADRLEAAGWHVRTITSLRLKRDPVGFVTRLRQRLEARRGVCV